MKPSQDAARIFDRIRRGERLEAIAQDYGVSRQAIHQLWKRLGDGTSLRHGVPGHNQCRHCGAYYPRSTQAGHALTPEHRAYRRAANERRFWNTVEKQADGCWVWTGAINPVTGYAQSHRTYVHRLAYEMVVGPIPDGLTIDHLCRNRRCVNPSHLEAVTARENILRSPIHVAAVNARKTHCPQGHPYDAENTYYSFEGRHRTCRTCARDRAHAYYLRRKAVA